MDKKRWILVLVLGLVLLTMVSCEGKAKETSGKVWDTILDVARMDFLRGNPAAVEGFIRLVVFLLVFTLLFFGSQQLGMGRTGGIVAFLVAVMGTIFIPSDMLVFIGEVYGTVFAWALIVAAIFALFFIIYYLPPNTWWGQLLRIFILILLLWIFTGVSNHAEELARAGNVVVV